MNLKLYNEYYDESMRLYRRLLELAEEINTRYIETEEIKYLLIYEKIKTIRRMADVVNCRMDHLADLCGFVHMIRDAKVKRKFAERIVKRAESFAYMFGRDGFIVQLGTRGASNAAVKELAGEYIKLFELALACLEREIGRPIERDGFGAAYVN